MFTRRQAMMSVAGAAMLSVTLGAALRVAVPSAGDWYAHLLVCGGALWSAALLLFAVRYAPILFGARVRR